MNIEMHGRKGGPQRADDDGTWLYGETGSPVVEEASGLEKIESKHIYLTLANEFCSELESISSQYGDNRRTRSASDSGEPEYSAEDFIVDEDNVVIVSRDGWVKRQKEVKDLSTTRLREGDAVMAVCAGSTRASCVFFSNFGAAYTSKIIDVPASTGYGEPIQKQFKLKDGERLIAAMSLDPKIGRAHV